MILEMPLIYATPPQPEPKVTRGEHVKVFYTVVDYDNDKPFYETTLPVGLTTEVVDGSLVVGNVTFGPEAWRMVTHD